MAHLVAPLMTQLEPAAILTHRMPIIVRLVVRVSLTEESLVHVEANRTLVHESVRMVDLILIELLGMSMQCLLRGSQTHILWPLLFHIRNLKSN